MSSNNIPQAIPFDPPAVETIGQLLPAYSFDCLLATGGMGAVYKATQTSLDRPVAVKILPPELGADETFRQGFETEAKLMARLNHPNLIGVYDFGEVGGMLYIVMEFVDGTTLYEHAYQKQLPQLEAVEIITGICNGLNDAHKAGILHRDIKPANIFITKDGTPKIGDFGLARPSGNAESGVIYGTPGYAAPEVVASPEKVGPATDIFAVGVMLYELLAGKMPGQVYEPLERFGKFDNALERLIRKSMAADISMRTQSAEELSEQLTDVRRRIKTGQKLAPQATTALPKTTLSGTTARTTVSSKKVKKRSGTTAFSFLMIAALSVGIYYAWQHFQAKKTSVAETEQANEEIPDQIQVRADGTKVAVFHNDPLKNYVISDEEAEEQLAAAKPKEKPATAKKSPKKQPTPTVDPAPVGETPITKTSEPEEVVAVEELKAPALSEEEIEKQWIAELVEKTPALAEHLTEKRTAVLDGGKRLVSFIKQDMSWTEASEWCQQHGATLVTLNDDDDIAAVKSIMPSWAECWIGAYTEGDKQWNWADGTPWSDSIKLRTTSTASYAQVDSDVFPSVKRNSSKTHFLIEWKKEDNDQTANENSSSTSFTGSDS